MTFANPKESFQGFLVPLPNPQLNSDPACIASRSLSSPCFLGSAHCLGAGAAG